MWGGPRKGSGRPPGTGSGNPRTNRVVVMLSNDELSVLKRVADLKDLPLGTVAYEFVARGLKRAR
jgi:hypothetical protein